MKKPPTLQIGTSKMVSAYVFNEPFMVGFLNRREWKNGFPPNRNEGLIWYMDGSKTRKGTGKGVCGYGTEKRISFIFSNTPLYSRHKYIKTCNQEYKWGLWKQKCLFYQTGCGQWTRQIWAQVNPGFLQSQRRLAENKRVHTTDMCART